MGKQSLENRFLEIFNGGFENKCVMAIKSLQELSPIELKDEYKSVIYYEKTLLGFGQAMGTRFVKGFTDDKGVFWQIKAIMQLCFDLILICIKKGRQYSFNQRIKVSITPLVQC